MKKLFVIALALCFETACLAQDTIQKQHFAKKDFQKISTQQKTAAWLLTGAGTTGLLITLVVDAGQQTTGLVTSLFSFGMIEPEHKSYTVPYLLSAAGVIGGIYLFVAASKNKKKGASVFINMEKSPALVQSIFKNHSFPVAGVRIVL